MHEIFCVMLSCVKTKGFMYSRINELLVVLLLAKRKDEVPVSSEVLIVFKVDEFVFFHDDLF